MKLVLSILLFCRLAAAVEFDLVIRNGRVVDGTGAPAFFADVGIKDGRIARIGKIERGAAGHVIDATGLIVAPGFIDVHTHAEEILDLPESQNFVRMGVTTLMLGNCGGSSLDLEEYFRKVETLTVSPNVATLIGHNTVRAKAMGGSFDRVPTSEESAQMRELVERAMKAGAFGLSTGLIYLPGTFSRTEEIIDLARVAAEHGGIYVSHMRDEGLEIEDALNELFQVAREAKVRAHISHIKLSGKSAWGRTDRILELIDSARTQGLDITQDQYVYTASSTGIAQLVPEWAREGGKLDDRLRDPETKARIKQEMLAKLKRRGFDNFSYTVIAHYARPSPASIPGDRPTVEGISLSGLNIVEAAEKQRGRSSLDDQAELILEIVSNGGASGVFHGISERDLQLFLKHPNTMFAADSGVRKYKEGVPHPRGYGNNARVIHRYVNELGLLRLEEAIRRMTSLPASAFHIRERGQIQERFHADVVLLDPKGIRDQATFTQPHQYPSGIEHVFVNGTAVVEKGEYTGKRPGQIVRFNSSGRSEP